jgi:selenide,water dikinase
LSTALKNEQLPPELEPIMVDSMATTNRAAARAARAAGARGLTDVTGYGLLGHALEMAAASQVALEINASAVPLLEGARRAAETGKDFGGLKANRAWAAGRSNLDELDPVIAKLLCDPQTSGGLLAAVADGGALVEACAREGIAAAVIGHVVEGAGTAHVTVA